MDPVNQKPYISIESLPGEKESSKNRLAFLDKFKIFASLEKKTNRKITLLEHRFLKHLKKIKFAFFKKIGKAKLFDSSCVKEKIRNDIQLESKDTVHIGKDTLNIKNKNENENEEEIYEVTRQFKKDLSRWGRFVINNEKVHSQNKVKQPKGLDENQPKGLDENQQKTILNRLSEELESESSILFLSSMIQQGMFNMLVDLLKKDLIKNKLAVVSKTENKIVDLSFEKKKITLLFEMPFKIYEVDAESSMVLDSKPLRSGECYLEVVINRENLESNDFKEAIKDQKLDKFLDQVILKIESAFISSGQIKGERDLDLEKTMAAVQAAVSLGHAPQKREQDQGRTAS